MQIAHISDLHFSDPGRVAARRLLNKRITGYANLKLRRGSAHQRWIAEAVLDELRGRAPDHVVLTGDLGNLALENELGGARRFVQARLGLPPDEISIVPGNHDAYTRGSFRSRRFQAAFREHISSDLPQAPVESGIEGFPFVRLRGPVAVIGLSTARPRPPLVASGSLGGAQLDALERLLGHRELRERMPVILQHHPWPSPWRRGKTLLEGLVDGAAERAVLGRLSRGLVLHGHLHRRVRRTVVTERGSLEVIGATSMSLSDPNESRMAAFHLYELASNGSLSAARAFVFDPASRSFWEADIPQLGVDADER